VEDRVRVCFIFAKPTVNQAAAGSSVVVEPARFCRLEKNAGKTATCPPYVRLYQKEAAWRTTGSLPCLRSQSRPGFWVDEGRDEGCRLAQVEAVTVLIFAIACFMIWVPVSIGSRAFARSHEFLGPAQKTIFIKRRAMRKRNVSSQC
jgi:hypothetical protein